MNPSSDELATHPSLLLRVRDAGDRVAWAEFARIYGPMILGYCRSKRLQESDATDVAQEVMLRMTKAIGQFEYDPSLGRFRDWLGRVVRNELIRFWNQQKRQSNAVATGHPIDTEYDDASWTEYFQTAILHQALENIEPEFSGEHWKAFELSWLRDTPAQTVATMLNIGIETVYVAKSRALKRLRSEVQRLTDDLPVSK